MESGDLLLRQIGYIRTEFSTKFGVPRQSGLADAAGGAVVFLPEFQDPNYVRGLDTFTHAWILWGFSQARPSAATVRPPRLGGNQRVGVFASRSPFRPNPIAMSCVRLIGVTCTQAEGPIVSFAGADMVNGSPVYDIKPYVPADCRPEADTSFASTQAARLVVEDPKDLLAEIPESLRTAVVQLLSLDPRPAYHVNPDRIYGMEYGGFDIRFRVQDGTLKLEDVRRSQS